MSKTYVTAKYKGQILPTRQKQINIIDAIGKGQNVKARRLKLGIQGKDVAKMLGITNVSVTNKEANKTEWTVGEALKLAKIYKIETFEEFKKTFERGG